MAGEYYQLSNVTNSAIRRIQSAGSAYTMTGFIFNPDWIRFVRYTGFGTAGILNQGEWFRGFPSGDVVVDRVVADNGGTGNTTGVLETTNGITVASTGGTFTDQHLIITNITAATPGVVTTSTNHGLADDDRVIITKVVGSLGDTVNNMTFRVDVISSTEFELLNIDGSDYTTSGTYTSGGQVTKIGPLLNVQVSNLTYNVTLGTSVMGSDNDILYVMLMQVQDYRDLGDVA
jgi:Ubiquitin-activating enzyme E1 FCCH domain